MSAMMGVAIAVTLSLLPLRAVAAEKSAAADAAASGEKSNNAERVKKPSTAEEKKRVPQLTAQESAELFTDAVADYHRDDYVAAAAQFWSFLQESPASVENYGWGQYFLAESLNALGFSYSAMVYYYLVAKTRSQPEVISDALSRLETLAASTPIDEDLLYDNLLYGGDFGILSPAQNSWIMYVQGLYDYQRNFIEWGERHFKEIDKASPFALDAAYVKAVQAVREHRDNDALETLRWILDNKNDAPTAKNRAQLALARLMFERGQYREAIAAYDQVKQENLSYEQAQILVEKAWSCYYLKDYSRALGLLHALAAPSYELYFFPEMYLLRALIFKDLCHHLAAKNAVRSFRFKFARSLEQLKQRLPMQQIDRIRRASIMEGTLARRTHLLQNLQAEQHRLQNMSGSWESAGLTGHLMEQYETAIKQHDFHWRKQFEIVADTVGLRLLDTEEQINILDYEIGLAIYKPADDRVATLESDVLPALPDRATHNYYEFDGEYWNEELSSYQYYISSRCLGRLP